LHCIYEGCIRAGRTRIPKEEPEMSPRFRSFLYLLTLTFGSSCALSKISYSDEKDSVSTGTSYSFIDTICTIPYFNEVNITDPNHPLVIESKQAILSSGISEAYFLAHFQLLCAVGDSLTHRQVRWRYTLEGYTTLLHDEIGHSDGIRGRINLHSIGNDLKGFREIRQVVSKKKAEEIMRQCIGAFKEPSVFLGTGPPDYDYAGLYLFARAIKEVTYGKGGNRFDIGWVNLESGECSKLKGGAIHSHDIE
jgi:hypothetical protein